MTKSEPVSIAVIGGGLVGGFAQVALSTLPNVKVELYEKSNEKREAGAAITFTESSLHTLGEFFDIDELQKILYRSDKFKGLTVRHWKTGEYLSVNYQDENKDEDIRYQSAKSQRIQLHDFILNEVPESKINYGYEAVGVELLPVEDSSKVKVNFKDRPSILVDLVVAADGIYSKIRRQFTGDIIKYKGGVAYRNVFPEELVSDIEGLPEDFTVWVGPKSTMFMTKLKPGLFNIAPHIAESESVVKGLKWNESREDDFERRRVLEHFKDWDPLINKILERSPKFNAFPLEKTKWLENLAVGNKIAFVGDAAHPTSGVYGAGAGLGFDDVYALYLSLKEVYKLNDGYRLDKSLFLFNQVRSEFLNKIVQQIEVDSNTSKNYYGASKDDDDWRGRFLKKSFGTEWIGKHNVYLSFIEKRDLNFLKLIDEY